MMKVMPYDPSHEEVYNAFIRKKPKPNRKPHFFLQNLLKPTDRKHFETVTTLSICHYFMTVESPYLPSVLWHCWLGGRKGIRPVKNGGWWWWTLVSLDGVAPSRMVGVSASVNLPLHHEVQKFSSGTGSPGWSQKKYHKTVVVVVVQRVPTLNNRRRPFSYLKIAPSHGGICTPI